MIKAVIFDIDNTIYDYTGGDAAAKTLVMDYCLREFGVESEEFHDLYRRADRLMNERIGYACGAIHNRLLRFQCMTELMGKPLSPHVKALNRLYWDTLLGTIKPQPGFMELLARLKGEGIRIGIGTNMTADMQYEKLERLGVMDKIDWLVTSEECGAEKPDPKFFKLCLEKSGFDAGECLFVGDSLEGDVIGALRCGLKAVWYTALIRPEGECPSGIEILESFEGWTTI